MIYCPSCGTANREGSKFCNECGRRLSIGKEIRCGMCDTSNPGDSLLCSGCGSKLRPDGSPSIDRSMPAADSEGIAAGERAPSEAEPESMPSGPMTLPPWLERMRYEALAQESERETVEDEEPSLPGREHDVPEAGQTVEAWPDRDQSLDEPEWMARLRSISTFRDEPSGDEDSSSPVSEEDHRAAAEEELAGDDMPEWLVALRGRYASDEQESPPADQAAEYQTDDAALPYDEVAETSPAVQVFDESDLPPWLREIDDDLDQRQLETAVEEDIPSEDQPPHWLVEDVTPDEPEPPRADAPSESYVPVFPQDVISEWEKLELEPQDALRVDEGMLDDSEAAEPTSEVPQEDVEEEQPVTEGPLAGMRGVTAVALPIALPPDSQRIGSLLGRLSEEDDGGDLFARVIGAPAPAIPLPEKKAGESSLFRIMLSLLLVAAILIPMLTGSQALSGGLPISPMAESIYQQVQSLPANGAILVAFDYDPSTAGELGKVAETIVGHILARDLRMIAVSTLPAGPATAHKLLQEAIGPDWDERYGEQIINLGYLAGGEAALRSFALEPFGANRTDFVGGAPAGTQPALAGLDSLEDLSLIVVFGSSPHSIRWWIEQIGSRTSIPLAVGCSAADEPYLLPYASGDHPQVTGLVAGIRGAADYLQVSGQSGRSRLDLEALNWASLLAVAVIVASVVLSPFRSAGSRRASRPRSRRDPSTDGRR